MSVESQKRVPSRVMGCDQETFRAFLTEMYKSNKKVKDLSSSVGSIERIVVNAWAEMTFGTSREVILNKLGLVTSDLENFLQNYQKPEPQSQAKVDPQTLLDSMADTQQVPHLSDEEASAS